MTHSPTPWRFSQDLGSQHGCRLIHAADGRLVADAGRIPHRDPAEMDANARLIAAGPELLAALDHLLQQTVDMDLKHGLTLSEGEGHARGQALAAIAKAAAQEAA